MDGLDPGAQARFFYLAILLLAVTAGVFGMYRGRLGEAARHAAVWALIFMGAMIAYGFRDQLSTQLFGPAQETVSENAVALPRSRDGHFHATAEVNGREVRFVVDTGATAIVLSRQDAARVGIDPEALTYVIPAMTANGRVLNAGVTLDSLSVGPFEDRDVQAMVNGGELGVSLLGMSWLNRFAGWRVEGDRMILER